MKTNNKRVRVKGWVVLTKRNLIYFATSKTKRSSSFRTEAKKAHIPYKVVPCQITYELPTKPTRITSKRK